MPHLSTSTDRLSTAETDALTRFVHDLKSRMGTLTQLLQDRGTSRAAGMADLITERLSDLEQELAIPSRAGQAHPLLRHKSAAG